MMKNYLCLLALALLLCKCHAQIDADGDLGGGYSFNADGGMSWISGGNVYEDGIPGNIISFGHDHDYIIATQSPSKAYYHYFFPEDIIYRYRFLLYKEEISLHPNAYHQRFMNSKWWLDTELKTKITKHISADNYNNIEEITRIVDSLVIHDPAYQKIFSSKVNYWILVKQGNQVFGPLSHQQYLDKRKELSVPDELQLDE